jgi:hypothetical protein
MKNIEEILKILFPTRVSFEDGSYIEYLNREAIQYVEANGHRMGIDWYFQKGHIKGRVLYESRINSWDPPYKSEKLTQQKKEEITHKIIEYCKKRKISLLIEQKPSWEWERK